MTSRLVDTTKKTKIRLTILGPGKTHGEADVALYRNYTTTLKCLENDSEAYLMDRQDFFRMFKKNDEAWKLMFQNAQQREKQIYQTC